MPARVTTPRSMAGWVTMWCAAHLAAIKPDTAGLALNIGSVPETVPTVVGQIEALVKHGNATCTITTIPAILLRNAARILNVVGMSPIVPEHYLLADATFILDIKRAREALGWEPKGDNVKITCDAFDWYMQNWEAVAPKPHPALRLLEAIT